MGRNPTLLATKWHAMLAALRLKAAAARGMPPERIKEPPTACKTTFLLSAAQVELRHLQSCIFFPLAVKPYVARGKKNAGGCSPWPLCPTAERKSNDH